MNKKTLRIAEELVKTAEDLVFADSDYIYDPDHKKHPGGGYHKTEKGWSKKEEKKEKENNTKSTEFNELSNDKKINVILESKDFKNMSEYYNMISYNETAEEYLENNYSEYDNEDIDEYNDEKIKHIMEWKNGPQFNDFDFNDEATSFSEINLVIDGEWEVKDFGKWLEEYFPKEYKALQTLSNNELWGDGFESYVCEHLVDNGHSPGIYIEYGQPLISFNMAKHKNSNDLKFDITKLSPEMREKLKDWDAEDIAKFLGWLKENKN